MSFVISVPNKLAGQSSKHPCNICGKKYTNKSSLSRHIILCEITNKTPRERLIDNEEEADLPDYKQLVMLVQELTKKCTTMERKMEEMQKFVQKTKKKINVLQWLNETTATNAKPTMTFQDWFQSLVINESTVLFLTENTMYQTLEHIFCKNLPEETNNPICGFTQKQGILYICESLEPYVWVPLPRDQFIRNLNLLHLKILSELMAWRDKNDAIITDNDKMAEKYNKTMMKLMGINFTQEAVFSKIKCALFAYLKKDIKNLLEYEVEF